MATPEKASNADADYLKWSKEEVARWIAENFTDEIAESFTGELVINISHLNHNSNDSAVTITFMHLV